MTEIAVPGRQNPVFSPVAVIAMLAAGLFSFSAFITLSAYAPNLRGGADPGAHALSPSAIGYSGLVRLLRDLNRPVEISRKAAVERDPKWSLLVLTPGLESSSKHLQNFSVEGPTLVVLPKWEVAPDPLKPGWVYKDDLLDADNIEKVMAAAGLDLRVERRAATLPFQLTSPGHTGAIETGPIYDLQTIDPNPALAPILVNAHGDSVLVRVKALDLEILSDPDILNTQGLKDPHTALVAAEILNHLRRGSGPIAFDVTLNGFDRPPSLLKLALSPPYLGATLCLVSAGLLMGLRAAARFGPPRRTERSLAFGKRALADSAAGLIRMARREPAMAPRYLELTRAAVARALGVTRLSGAELDAYLDRIADAEGLEHRLSALGAEAGAVKTRADLIKIARDLHHWRLEMIRERR